jgi:hypothetical protein
MIKIIPFQNDIFDNAELNKCDLTSYTYITPVKLVNKLMDTKLPIEKRKALIRIFNFLNFLDSHAKDDNTLRINKFKLEEFLTRNKYREYMQLLRKLNVIHKVRENGEYNSCYYKKLNPKNNKIEYFSNGRFYKDFSQVPTPIPTKYKLHRDYSDATELAIVILEEKKKEVPIFNCEIEKLNAKYQNTIKGLNLNVLSAINAEVENWKIKQLSNFALRIRISKILSTSKGRYIKKGKKVNRIYHSFVNISRVAREHLDKKFYSLDIVNCQPLMLVAYLKENNMSVDLSYQKDCEIGKFYENFYDLNDLIILDDKRSKVKSSIYQNIFFGFYKKSRYNKIFKELYPKTWDSLCAISKTKISLASRLQNMEASLFNNLFPKYSKYYYTLFDAIYYTNKTDTKQLTKEINFFFDSLNIKTQIK